MQKPSIGARAGSSSTRKQLEGFGSVGLPGSGRLDDKRYKAHTLEQRASLSQACLIRSLWQQEAGFLNLGLEAGAVGPGSQKVAQRVVPLSPLPTSSTGACMKGEFVQDPVTFGAPRVGRSVGHPQAPSKLHHKRSALHASTPSWDGGKPRTRALLSLGTQESAGCDRRHRQVPVPTGRVGEGRKPLLLHAQGEVSGAAARGLH